MNNVSSSKFNISEIKKQAEITIKTEEYKEFCQKYMGQNFSNQKIIELTKIYRNGMGLLEQHYITNDIIESNIIIQLQYIVNNVSYEIWNKQANEIKLQNLFLKKESEEIIQRAKDLEKEAEIRKEEIKDMKKDMKSITTTIISIILAISIIPTAITGVQKIDANYILPFLSSIMLFGMIMIIFVYSIYQDKIKKSTWVFFMISLITCIALWVASLKISIEKEESKNDQIQQEVIQE